MLVAVGVGTVRLINLTLFRVWVIPIRTSQIAVTTTGIFIAGAARFWRAILGFFWGLSRKFSDQAVTMEKAEHVRRVA